MTVPYATDQTTNSYNNHTFWLEYGAYGSELCADDYEKSQLCDYTFSIDNVSVLEIGSNWENANWSSGTEFWINFLTQCENCTNDLSGIGAWHKDTQDWPMGYFSTKIMDDLSDDNALIVEFRQTVDCDPFSQYGCQSDELRD